MLDIDKLIDAVQRRPALYDMKSRDYSDRNKKAKCWNEVGEEVYDDWNDVTTGQRNVRGKLLMKKWKALRDNFVRDYKVLVESGSLRKKKYLFYDQLTFLAPYVKHSDKVPSVPSDEEDRGEERMLSSLWDELSSSDLGNGQPLEASVVVVHEDSSSEPPKRKAKRPAVQETVSSASSSLIHEIQEGSAGKKEECNSDRHGNKAFLLSYLPIMDGLPQQAQLHARMLITQVFYDLQTQSGPGASQCATE